jgi:tetratricopeptide (TPR) repeat protein
MIELLLEAERAITVGLIDQAERLYEQAAEADPRNAIAVVGLARVALERGDDRGAYELAQRALAIDSENEAARRMIDRLGEVMRYRGEEPPGERVGAGVPQPVDAGPDPAETESAPPQAVGPEPAGAERRPGLLDRLLRRRRE